VPLTIRLGTGRSNELEGELQADVVPNDEIVHAFLPTQPTRTGRLSSGPGRDRTADLLGAIQARSQLRYGPLRPQDNPSTSIHPRH